MIIKECYIEGFGMLHNLRKELRPGLNVIKADNGSGKTTLSVFIRVMLFGMEQKRARDSVREKYRPWDGGKYGGYIVFEANGKTYRAERYFNETESKDTFSLYDASSGLQSNDFTSALGQELFSTDKETFSKTAYIPYGKAEAVTGEEGSLILALEADNESDDKSFKKAMTSLGKAKAFYEKRGGKISELENELSRISDEIAECEALIPEKQALDEKIKEKKRKLEQLKIKRKQLNSVGEQSLIKEQISCFEERIAKNISLMKRIPSDKELSELKRLTDEYRQLLEKSKESKAKNKVISALIAVIIALTASAFALGYIKKLHYLYTAVIPMQIICVFSVCFLIGSMKKFKKKAEAAFQKLESLAYKFTSEEPLLAAESLSRLISVISSDRESIGKYEDKLGSYGEPSITEEPVKQSLDEDEENLMGAICLDESKALKLEEKISSLVELYEGKNAAQEELYTSRKESFIINEAIDALKLARENVGLKYAKGIRAEFSSLCDELSAPEGAFINADFSLSIHGSSEIHSINALSSGEKDVLYIALRFALIKAMYKSEHPPIVLDDPLISLDAKKQKGAKSLISRLAADYQILYFTCDDKRAEF